MIFKKLFLLAVLFGCISTIQAAEPLSSNAKQGDVTVFTEGADKAPIENAEEDFLPPDEAFKLNVTQKDAGLNATFTVVPGYYLYKERIKVSTTPSVETTFTLPVGEIKDDPNFGRMEVYHHDFSGIINLNPLPSTPFKLTVKYQGCSEKGLCYAPQTKVFDFAGFANANINTSNAQPSNQESSLNGALKSGNLWLIAGVFFVAGLLLSLTPCVLPMIPILSGIIIGSNKNKTLSKLATFNLSLAYVLGMALAYTLAGVAAGLSGQLLSNTLQNVWVLGATALLFVVLALSMFGLYELRLPSSIEGRLINTSNNLKGGKFAGVFGMGALSALIVSPCVAAPLAGALIYISQTHNLLLGGVALFALAIGMGVPLLLIGASAGALLPKAGKWMTLVRNLFGVLMLAMAVWIVLPVLPETIKQPLDKLLDFKKAQLLQFEQIKNLSELNAKIKAANGKPVMLDFYADWCTACKELEHSTFADTTVAAALKDTVLLQIDITGNTADDREMLKNFGLFGPPAILFFDVTGSEIKAKRVIGYKNAKKFLANLAQ